MTKAINWPAQYLNDVINENDQDVKIALRLGSIYYDHSYYVPNEVVDIRVNHKIIRQGIIADELKLCKISEITQDDLEKNKPGLDTIDSVVSYLSSTYNQDVSPETIVTIVYYKNMGSDTLSGLMDDPHM